MFGNYSTLIAFLSALLVCSAPALADEEPACGSGPPAPVGAGAEVPDPAARAAELAAGKLTVELFVMSKCPFGVQAEQILAPVLEELGDAVRFRLDFIGSLEDGQLTSMHGPSEVMGDRVQACAAELFPKKLMRLVGCMNRDMQAIPDGWEACAGEVGLDATRLGACVRGAEGQGLLTASFARARRSGARGSPTLIIGGKPYAGPRTEKAILRAVCSAFSGERPEACAAVKPPVSVPLTLFFDSRCKECRHEGLVTELAALMPGLQVERVDYATAAGRARYQKLGLGLLPVLRFGPEIEQADGFEMLKRYLEPTGKQYTLKLRGEWDPTAEICDNGVDDDGDTQIDCKDPDCEKQLICRAEVPGRLDVFVMSQCPYALKAIDAMRAVLGQLGQDVDFHIHYIASVEGEGFNSLHGPPEVAEDIRQLCARAHHAAGRRYLDYIWCRNQNIRSDAWQACAEGNGLDTARLAACAEGDEGAKLLRADLGLAAELGIGASPTWLVNNRILFHGIDAGTIIENYCRHNPTRTGCAEENPRGAK